MMNQYKMKRLKKFALERKWEFEGKTHEEIEKLNLKTDEKSVIKELP